MRDITQLFEFLRIPRRIAIIPHVRPDGDAIGSSVALRLFLEKHNHQVSIISPDDFPDFLNWMPGADQIYIHLKNPKTCFALLTKVECIFFLDFNAMKRIEALSEEIKKLRQPVVTIMIDHHREPEDFTDYALWSDEASSTAELIYEFIVKSDGLGSIDQSIAACLYTGIALDTGVFQYSNTTARVHEIVADLMKFGIDIEKIHNAVYNQFGENRLRFIGYLLSNKMQIVPEHRLAYMTLSMAEAEQFKLGIGDKEGIVNLPLAMKDVDIAVLFTEDKDRIKISFRSKGDANVEILARNFFQGGGHKNASGGSTRMNLDDSVSYLIQVLPEFESMTNQA